VSFLSVFALVLFEFRLKVMLMTVVLMISRVSRLIVCCCRCRFEVIIVMFSVVRGTRVLKVAL